MSDWQTFLTKYNAPSDVWGAYQQLQSLPALDSGISAKVAGYRPPTDQAGYMAERANQNPYGFTPQEQTAYDTYNTQRNNLTNRLLDYQHQVAPSGSPFTRFMHGLEQLPIIGDVAAGANEVFGRPGDLFSDPAKFIGKAAAGAAPFLGAEIGPWAKVMGTGGHLLSGGGLKNPLDLLGTAALTAAPFIGGDAGKYLGGAGKLFNAARSGMDPLALAAIGAPFLGGNQDLSKGLSLADAALNSGGRNMDFSSLLGGLGGALGQSFGGNQGGQIGSFLGNLGSSFLGGNQQGQPYPGNYGGNGSYGSYGAPQGNQQGMAWNGGGNSPNDWARMIGNGIDLFTNPSGIKLFGGGNYADNGMGDKALGYANTLGNTGNQFLNAGLPQQLLSNANNFNQQGQSFLNQANQGLPMLSNLGQLSNMPNIIGQIADTAGIQNPMTGQGGGNDPYALHPHEQEAFNTSANMVNQGRTAAISNLRQQLASRGINDPRAIAAAEAAINASHNGMLQQAHSTLAGQAFGTRQQAQGELAQLFPQLYGAQNQAQQQGYGNAQQFLGMGNAAQSNALNAGANLLNLPIQAYQNAGQQAINQNRYSQNQIGQGLSQLFPPSATGQFGNLIPRPGGTQGGYQGSPWIQPGQPGFDTGAGNPGGVGPMPDTGAGIDWNNYNPWSDQSYAPDYQAWSPQDYAFSF